MLCAWRRPTKSSICRVEWPMVQSIGGMRLVPFQLVGPALVGPNTCKRAWEPGLEIRHCFLWPEKLDRHEDEWLVGRCGGDRGSSPTAQRADDMDDILGTEGRLTNDPSRSRAEIYFPRAVFFKEAFQGFQ